MQVAFTRQKVFCQDLLIEITPSGISMNGGGREERETHDTTKIIGLDGIVQFRE